MSTDLQVKFSRSSAGALFKTIFKTYMDDVMNTRYTTWGRINKVTTPFGKQLDFAQMLGIQGGIGSSANGELPQANVGNYQTPRLTSKRVYARAYLDRDSIYSSMDDKAAFAKANQENLERGAKSNAWNMSRMLFNNLDNGELGAIASGGVTDNGGGNYTLTISDATWKEANFEENLFVNIESGNTDLFGIEEVDPDNKQITVQRQAGGTQVPANGDEIFLQGSEGNDFESLHSVLSATAGTKYNVTVGRRWQRSYYKNLGRAITSDDINRAILQIEKKVGEPPTNIVTSTP